MSDKENFFEKYGLEVQVGEVEIGKTYPIYGMITRIISDKLSNVLVEVNYSMEVELAIDTQEKLDIIKERAFDSGIFICEILSKATGEPIKAYCTTVVFGRRENLMQ